MTACTGTSTHAPPKGTSAEIAGDKVKVESVLTFDVAVAAEHASFLRAYADGTHMGIEEANGSVVAGPFLSRYEAMFVAGCAAGAHVSLHDAYDEPATPEPFMRGTPPGLGGRELVSVETRRLFGERFALVTWDVPAGAVTPPEAAPADTKPGDSKPAKDAKAADAKGGKGSEGENAKDAKAAGAKGGKGSEGENAKDARAADAKALPRNAVLAPTRRDLELFIVHGSAPRLVARLPGVVALDIPAAGLLAAKLPTEIVYLSAASVEHSDALRAERLVAWRDGPVERELAFERSLFQLAQPEGGVPTVNVTRIAAGPSALELSRYRVELALTDAAKDIPLGTNDWSSTAWSGKTPVELCRIVQTSPAEHETVSLE